MKILVEFLKLISDETRLRILVLLLHRKMCVCEMCDVLEESQPKVSRHLARLRDAGYIQDDRQGQWVFYYSSFKNSIHEEIMEVILKYLESYPQLIADIDRYDQKVENGTLCTRK